MNITKEYLLDKCRRKCLSCDNAKKLIESHCNDKSCELFEIRKYQIDKSRQLTMFTYDGFIQEVKNILTCQSMLFYGDMYFSDIRKTIESVMIKNRSKIPEGKALASWWGKVAAFVLPKNGWVKDHTRKRRSPMRGDDYLYVKKIN